MAFREASTNPAITDIETMNIDGLMVGYIPKTTQARFKSLIETGVLEDKVIEEALKIAVIRTAKDYFSFLTTEDGTYQQQAHHVLTPAFLAYAINENVFSQKELQAIPFDHGMTPWSYCQRYHDPELLARLRHRLTGTSFAPLMSTDKSGYDAHP